MFTWLKKLFGFIDTTVEEKDPRIDKSYLKKSNQEELENQLNDGVAVKSGPLYDLLEDCMNDGGVISFSDDDLTDD